MDNHNMSGISSTIVRKSYEKEPDTANEDENIENCELFYEADSDDNNYENDRDVELATNDEETENSDYELFCETDNNNDMFEITGRRLIKIAYFFVSTKGR
ncbi:hypothetical protein FQA39_LY15670 [Lamprigera yunnana]|nr:hypothetical protein FQA39_LY15670 [Lamprigera yunnana]